MSNTNLLKKFIISMLIVTIAFLLVPTGYLYEVQAAQKIESVFKDDELILATGVTESTEEPQPAFFANDSLPESSESSETVSAATESTEAATTKPTEEPTTEAPYPDYKITINFPSGYKSDVIYIDGISVSALSTSGLTGTFDLTNSSAKTAVAYKYDSSNVPIGMYVWKLDWEGYSYKVTALTDFENLLQYQGFSIRITGKSGIRVKYSIDKNVKAKLTSSGINGWKLSEYGTITMLTANGSKYPLVKGGTKTASGLSYWTENGKVNDKIVETVDNRDRFAAVVINLPTESYNKDLSFRAYIILNNGSESITLYGPVSQSSIYTVAKKAIDRKLYSPGTSQYNYLKSIITSVEGGGLPIIVIDPGHGGNDPGASASFSGGFCEDEATMNLVIATSFMNELKKYGVPVYMTRYDSMAGKNTLTLQERADIALSYNATYLISCHNNAYYSSSHGVEVIIPNDHGPNGAYYHKEGIGLANALLTKLTAMGIADRGYYTRDIDDGRVYSDGSVADYYGVIRNAKNNGITGIIIEHAFVTNEADYWGFLSTEDKLAALGRADAQAIASYLGLK